MPDAFATLGTMHNVLRGVEIYLSIGMVVFLAGILVIWQHGRDEFRQRFGTMPWWLLVLRFVRGLLLWPLWVVVTIVIAVLNAYDEGNSRG